jgi:hypothetical protein
MSGNFEDQGILSQRSSIKETENIYKQ